MFFLLPEIPDTKDHAHDKADKHLASHVDSAMLDQHYQSTFIISINNQSFIFFFERFLSNLAAGHIIYNARKSDYLSLF